jgi:hypothetical protein
MENYSQLCILDSRSVVSYQDVESDWKLDLFASLITTTNYKKSPTGITT